MSLSPSSTLVDESAFDSDFYNSKALLSHSDSSMSLSGDFSFLTGTANSFDPALPSLLPSLLSENALDFDFDAISHGSPSSERTFDSFATPSSVSLVSPKSGYSSFTPSSTLFTDATAFPAIEQDHTASLTNAEHAAAIASYEHHQSRYVLYQACALQAEQNVRINQVQIDNLLSFNMSGAGKTFDQSIPGMEEAQPFYGVADTNAFSFTVAAQQQAQATAASMHAQAQAHMQARDIALARAQQQQRSVSMNYYLPSQRSTFEPIAPSQSMWSRQSASSIASPPFPSTPNYTQEALPLAVAKASSTNYLPNMVTGPFSTVSHPTSEGENEVDDSESEDNEDDDDFSGMAVANPHGGGRGYIPGKTPDDPKKKHKCNVCGRGFARAFNLKSHAQTHNPTRSKPHQCPHPSCKRGFSRLHDLERHRQGIHSDGPLVDAKRQGVPPAIARAQNRTQRRAESSQRII